MASDTLATCTISRTACTLTICAPSSTLAVTAAALAQSRSSGGTSPMAARRKDFLDGPAIPSDSDFRGPRLHASNGPLSGSIQTGADDTFLFLGNDGTVYTWNTLTGEGTYCPGCVGWNKTSDGNVQVFAHRPFQISSPHRATNGPNGAK